MTGIANDIDMPDAPKSQAAGSAIHFDGKSNQRRVVTLLLADRLEIRDGDTTLAAWAYADIRRADGPSGVLRLSSLTAPALARLEVRDTALAADLASRCTGLDENALG
ncbi:MAG: metalloendopeptidase, partial [Bradyrhizobium sp.]|nr:metalloendopeptidase [Bradyrhizobium sp.]